MITLSKLERVDGMIRWVFKRGIILPKTMPINDLKRPENLFSVISAELRRVDGKTRLSGGGWRFDELLGVVTAENGAK